jgi:hypothetical protein
MKCPGQDPARVNPEAVFEVPCPSCSEPVEFLGDEPSRQCARCGHRFTNPHLAAGDGTDEGKSTG